MSKEITTGNLEKVLLKLGFYATPVRGSHITYRHPSSDTVVVLPWQCKNEVLRPIHLISVKKTLSETGILDPDSFESLLEREVQAASSS